MNREDLILNVKSKIQRLSDDVNELVESHLGSLYDLAYEEALRVSQEEVQEELDKLRDVADKYYDIARKFE